MYVHVYVLICANIIYLTHMILFTLVMYLNVFFFAATRTYTQTNMHLWVSLYGRICMYELTHTRLDISIWITNRFAGYEHKLQAVTPQPPQCHTTLTPYTPEPVRSSGASFMCWFICIYEHTYVSHTATHSFMHSNTEAQVHRHTYTQTYTYVHTQITTSAGHSLLASVYQCHIYGVLVQ